MKYQISLFLSIVLIKSSLSQPPDGIQRLPPPTYIAPPPPPPAYVAPPPPRPAYVAPPPPAYVAPDQNPRPGPPHISPIPQNQPLRDVVASRLNPNINYGQGGAIVSDSKPIESVAYGGGVKRKQESYVSPEIQVSSALRRIENTQVNCQKNHMIVTLSFSFPFSGYLYIYENFPKCILFSGHLSDKAEITLYQGLCGQQLIANQNEPGFNPVIEHRLMIQWERDFLGEDDSSIIVRCERPDDFNKTISWKVSTLELDATIKRSTHPAGEEVRAIEQVQPGALQVNQPLPQPVQPYSGRLQVIENECSTKPTLFSHFYKERATKEGNLVTTHYAHFKAFRFPTSKRVVIQCDVRVCYKDCDQLPACNTGFQPRAIKEERRRRSVDSPPAKADRGSELDTVPFSRSFAVLNTEEAPFKGIPIQSVQLQSKEEVIRDLLSSYCYSPNTFYSWIAVLGVSTAVLLFIVIWCYVKKERRINDTSKH